MQIEIWQSRGGRWHWHFRDNKTRIITNGTAFMSKSDALREARACVRSIVKPCSGNAAVLFTYRSINNITEMHWS